MNNEESIEQLKAELRHATAIVQGSVGQPDFVENVAYRDSVHERLERLRERLER